MKDKHVERSEERADVPCNKPDTQQLVFLIFRVRDRLQGLRAYVHDRERAIAAVRLRNVRLEGTLLRLTRAPRRHQVLLVLKPEEVGDVVEVLRV